MDDFINLALSNSKKVSIDLTSNSELKTSLALYDTSLKYIEKLAEKIQQQKEIASINIDQFDTTSLKNQFDKIVAQEIINYINSYKTKVDIEDFSTKEISETISSRFNSVLTQSSLEELAILSWMKTNASNPSYYYLVSSNFSDYCKMIAEITAIINKQADISDQFKKDDYKTLLEKFKKIQPTQKDTFAGKTLKELNDSATSITKSLFDSAKLNPYENTGFSTTLDKYFTTDGTKGSFKLLKYTGASDSDKEILGSIKSYLFSFLEDQANIYAASLGNASSSSDYTNVDFTNPKSIADWSMSLAKATSLVVESFFKGYNNLIPLWLSIQSNSSSGIGGASISPEGRTRSQGTAPDGKWISAVRQNRTSNATLESKIFFKALLIDTPLGNYIKPDLTSFMSLKDNEISAPENPLGANLLTMQTEKTKKTIASVFNSELPYSFIESNESLSLLMNASHGDIIYPYTEEVEFANEKPNSSGVTRIEGAYEILGENENFSFNKSLKNLSLKYVPLKEIGTVDTLFESLTKSDNNIFYGWESYDPNISKTSIDILVENWNNYLKNGTLSEIENLNQYADTTKYLRNLRTSTNDPKVLESVSFNKTKIINTEVYDMIKSGPDLPLNMFDVMLTFSDPNNLNDVGLPIDKKYFATKVTNIKIPTNVTSTKIEISFLSKNINVLGNKVNKSKSSYMTLRVDNDFKVVESLENLTGRQFKLNPDKDLFKVQNFIPKYIAKRPKNVNTNIDLYVFLYPNSNGNLSLLSESVDKSFPNSEKIGFNKDISIVPLVYVFEDVKFLGTEDTLKFNNSGGKSTTLTFNFIYKRSYFIRNKLN
jgi:hypothetical protein